MKVIFITAVLATLLFSVLAGVSFDIERKTPEQLFKDWLAVYPHRFTSTADKNAKFAIFKANLAEIKALNAKAKGKARFNLGPNALETKRQFQSRLGSLNPSPAQQKKIPPLPDSLKPHAKKRTLPWENTQEYDRASRGAPTRMDWREVPGVITPVKDQGPCGSCWTFSATGAIEAAWAINGHPSVSLSEQELVDCVKPDKTGCHGGWMGTAFAWARDNGGVHSEAAYPYTHSENLECKRPTTPTAARVTGAYSIPAGDVEALVNWVGLEGPVAICVNASDPSWQHYAGGVIETDCVEGCNHAVLIVGYDVTPAGTPYWIIKNSWGTWWGNEGYVYMKISKSKSCPINMYGVVPTVAPLRP